MSTFSFFDFVQNTTSTIGAHLPEDLVVAKNKHGYRQVVTKDTVESEHLEWVVIPASDYCRDTGAMRALFDFAINEAWCAL